MLMIDPPSFWSRRAWLARNGAAAALGALVPGSTFPLHSPATRTSLPRDDSGPLSPPLERIAPGLMQTLALRAVDAATSAGAQYADARLTRITHHAYRCDSLCSFEHDEELVGIGVRILVNGYWGFAASPFWTVDDVAELVSDAVAQAQENAKGPPRVVELGHIPVATGSWSTPVKIDPFTITIEEKRDTIQYWRLCAQRAHVPFDNDGVFSMLHFVRHERVLATSDGSLTTQTTYESGGNISCVSATAAPGSVQYPVHGIGVAGKGWELFLDANLPEQFLTMRQGDRHGIAPPMQATRPALVGRYTLVCDGATMAALVERTFGVGTQLDRALGYEANARGTSFLDDPLAMVGTLKVASPLVNITTNRSAPAQLGTIQWDDEGVVPPEAILVHDGVLTDFQTTREQAAWLAPYYQKHGKRVRSNGCAGGESALAITMQHMPNLAMLPGTSELAVNDLISDVADGILIERGTPECDFQARGGMLSGAMREIKNGRLGRTIVDGAVLFDTLDLWRNVVAVGGAATQGGVDSSQYDLASRREKGQPAQATSHSVRAVAATIANQALVNPSRRS